MSPAPKGGEIAPAATAVLLRDGDQGLEVLLIERGPTLRFGGGMWVFPGGRVEPADEAAAAAAGVTEPAAAAACAAAREAQEEVGLPVDPRELVYFSHWLAPPDLPRRFATSFFMAAAPSGEVVVDGSETTDHVWIRPREALERRDHHELTLMPPTWVTLHDLAAHASVADALADAAAHEPRCFTTKPVTIDGERVALFPGDAGFDRADPALAGARHRLLMGRERWSFERTGLAPDGPRINRPHEVPE